MKKFILIMVSIVVIASIVVAGFLIFGVDVAKMKAEWGTTKMYVHITENGKEEVIGAESRDPFSRYYYTLTAYDEQGNEATVSFSAHKNLRLDSFLLVYVKDAENGNPIRDIGRYDEVTKEAIPVKAREKLGVE
ncbi:YxeA family protein [Paenibacillus dendritiformis]|uniref:YxeA family protein n=1 Tax=Paenibacillus dendritiformis TaxID=130049 RepID=UPI001059A252|nr:YxeA family protein [Paenibacillus dendritiformis]TDL57128.1 YxeA family protein [Paenibacillus dendritiformis]